MVLKELIMKLIEMDASESGVEIYGDDGGRYELLDVWYDNKLGVCRIEQGESRISDIIG